jgi:hypothetical protein
MNLFLTFRTYGTWLPGEVRGSIDEEHNIPGQPRRPVSRDLRKAAEASMQWPPFVVTREQRTIVEAAIQGVIAYRNWALHELNVRTNHVHMILSIPEGVT